MRELPARLRAPAPQLEAVRHLLSAIVERNEEREAMNINIREAIATDFTSIDELLRQGDNFHHAGLPTIFNRPSTPARSSAFYQAWLDQSSEVAAIVAEDDDKIIGILHAYIRQPPQFALFRDRRYLQIDSMVVDESRRNQGIGSMLLASAEAWAQERGLDRLELNVFDFNRDAVEFYRDRGFHYISHQMYKNLETDES
jgi:GNAT superfamily N-acetyltransferase